MSVETDFYNVVESVYALALEDDNWSTPLVLMADSFNAVGVSFEIIETATKQPLLMEYGSELGDAPTQSYLEYYGSISPRVKFGIRQPTGSISYDHMIFSESEIDRDEFYTDCIAPQGLRYFLGAKLLCSASHDAVFSIQRSPQQGHADSENIATLERLLPYLQRAMDLKFRVAEARTKGEVGLDGLERLDEGCLIIDVSGNVLHMNATASELLSNGDGIGLTSNCFALTDKAASQQYGRALTRLSQLDDNPAPDFSARRPSGRRPYMISLRNLPEQNPFSRVVWPAAAILFIRDPDRFTRLNLILLQQSYDLTAVESEIAVAFDKGLALRDIAAERQVSITTVRSHLYTLMAKMNVRRQVDLVRLLAQYRLPFR